MWASEKNRTHISKDRQLNGLFMLVVKRYGNKLNSSENLYESANHRIRRQYESFESDSIYEQHSHTQALKFDKSSSISLPLISSLSLSLSIFSFSFSTVPIYSIPYTCSCLIWYSLTRFSFFFVRVRWYACSQFYTCSHSTSVQFFFLVIRE